MPSATAPVISRLKLKKKVNIATLPLNSDLGKHTVCDRPRLHPPFRLSPAATPFVAMALQVSQSSVPPDPTAGDAVDIVSSSFTPLDSTGPVDACYPAVSSLPLDTTSPKDVLSLSSFSPLDTTGPETDVSSSPIPLDSPGPIDVPVTASPSSSPTVAPVAAPVLSASAQLFRPAPFRHNHHYERDRLDDHIEELIQKYESSPSWGDFIRGVRGRGDLSPAVGSLKHPAAHLLSRYQKVCTPAIIESDPWTPDRIKAALKRGPHSSCVQGIQFLQEEYSDMVDKQQWIVLPAALIQEMFGLRLSPLGLVPQRGRRDRMISDYSYYDVNQETLNIAPNEAMQFGRTLWRLLYRIHHANDAFGPVYMSKIDLSDGFYRLWVRPEDAHRLGVVFPSRPNKPPLIGIPLANPMGHV